MFSKAPGREVGECYRMGRLAGWAWRLSSGRGADPGLAAFQGEIPLPESRRLTFCLGFPLP